MYIYHFAVQLIVNQLHFNKIKKIDFSGLSRGVQTG